MVTPPRLPKHGADLVFIALILLLLCAVALRGAPVGLPQIREHLTFWEGYRLTPYRDGPSGGYSVGVGHSLSANAERVKPRYTALEVERMLLKDISTALDTCRGGIERFDDLPERAQLVAISVAFGVGKTGFQRFSTFRRALSARDYPAAARALRRSKWARDVGRTRAEHHVEVLLSLP